MGLPEFVIVGAQKSGTTTLAYWLRHHSKIALAAGVRFFDLHYHRGMSWYASQLPESPGKKIGEVAPSYSYHAKAIERMAAHLPELRLVMVLRNPIDRAYSHYWHNRARGTESLSFEDALDAEPDRISGGDDDRLRYSYVDRGRYSEQVERILQFYPRASLGVLAFEDLAARPAHLFAAACSTIGVAPEPIAVDTTRTVNPYVEYRWQRLRPLVRQLPEPLATLAGRLNTRRGVGYPPMEDAVRGRLRASFAPEPAKLEALLGQEFPQWR